MRPTIRPIFPGQGTDTFFLPHLAHWQQTGIDVVTTDADLDFYEWLEQPLIQHSRATKTCPRLVRVHSYEAFDDRAMSVHWPAVDGAVFVSRKVEAIIHDRFAINVPTFQARNGIDLDAFVIPPGKSWMAPRIGVLGNISAKKGPMLLCQVIDAICAEVEDATVHIAGRWDDPRYDLYFRDFVLKRQLQRRIEICGPVDDVRSWLTDKSYILATSPFESFGAGIGEAIASGCQPLIHDWPGSGEHWGFVPRWQTVAECVAALTGMVAEEESTRADAAEANRAELAKCHSRTRSLAELRAVVDDALAGTRGPDVITWREKRFLREQDFADFIDTKQRQHVKPAGLDKVLVHMPPSGGYRYIAQNLVLALDAFGYRVRCLLFEDDAGAVFDGFNPDLFLGCWERSYVERLPKIPGGLPCVWALGCFKDADPDQWSWLRSHYHGLDHFWTPVHDLAPHATTQHHLPYAAMPTAHHHRQSRVIADLAFCGTRNAAKGGPIDEWIVPLTTRYATQLYGVGWGEGIHPIPQNQLSTLYCSSKVCPNIHQPSQYETYPMLNERTFVIPACGGFEVCDHPPVLRDYYAEDEIWAASTPEEMAEMVERAFLDPRLRREMALRAHWRTLHEHTYFDRVTEMMGWLV